MTMPAIGSLVIIKPAVDPDEKYTGIVFKVTAHARVNISIQATGPGAQYLGKQARLRINPDMVEAAPDGYDADTHPTHKLVPLHSPISLGAVFTVPAGTLRGVDSSTLLVVIGMNGPAYKAARLGGDTDRYFPKVARAAMTALSLDELTERLAARN